MQRYIEQLISDLCQARSKMIPPHKIWMESESDPDDELELEDMSHVEKFIYGEKNPISEITGIATELFPPEEKLDQGQQALLASEMEELLIFFHFYLDFPKNYPPHLRYAFIRKLWDEEHVALSFGENHIEFCDYNQEQCPFPGFCNICEEINNDKINDPEQGNFSFETDDDGENLPF